MRAVAPDFGVIGYTDRWTYRPGEAVRLYLTAEESTTATVRLVRIAASDERIEDLAIDLRPVPGPELEIAVRPQRTAIGSWLQIDGLDRLPIMRGWALALHLKPTLVEGVHGLADVTAEGGGFAIVVEPDGTVALHAPSTGAAPVLRLPGAVAVGEWCRVFLSVDPRSGFVRLASDAGGELRCAEGPLQTGGQWFGGSLRFGAAPESVPGSRSFNGRLEAPTLFSEALEPAEALAALEAFTRSGDLGHLAMAAAWDFSERIDSDIAIDKGPQRLHGRFVNLPTRAVKGRLWDGSEQSWRHAPRHYGAVHLHEDDLLDAGWEAAGELALPADLASGVYAAVIEGPSGRDVLPIFVRPKQPGERSKLALLLPTFTYLAYANDRCLLHGTNPEVLAHRLLVLTPGDCCLAAHPEFGLSLYDTHRDGSGVVFASRRRPCLTMRHSQRAWQGGLGAGLWNFPADLLIVAWLERQGFDFEIVTDDDLDTQGHEALAPYRCVLTGSHPEYHTSRTLDAIENYLGAGGRLVSLGGNGFYWRVATHPAYPEVIELRRAEDGNRSWAAEPSEYYHAFDGAYGGLWRRNGRPPQALVGTGYVGQGFARSQPYRRLPASGDPRVAFLFEGLGDVELLGDYGLMGGGAAGIEIDRADASLGTPRHALVLATADRFDNSCFLANEEILVNRPTVLGELAPQLRSDLVYFETLAGGAVLATGSIAWAGAMAHPRAPNPISRLTFNAIRRFLHELPLSQRHD